MAKQTIRQICELEGAEAVHEPTKRFLVFSTEEFNLLSKFTGYSTNRGVKDALVELVRQVNDKLVVISKPEVETPTE